LKERGITVVMTTNYLDEADQLCDRLAIIDGGRIKAIGSPHDLKVGLGGDIVSLTVRAADMTRVEGLASELKPLVSIRSISTRPHGLDIRVESAEKALPAILEAANRLECRLEFIEYHRPKLDDVFVAHTGHAIRDESLIDPTS
jgi:ABC-2 type transport system ATP-binding protein